LPFFADRLALYAVSSPRTASQTHKKTAPASGALPGCFLFLFLIIIVKQDTKKPYPADTERPKLYRSAPPPLNMEGIRLYNYVFVHVALSSIASPSCGRPSRLIAIRERAGAKQSRFTLLSFLANVQSCALLSAAYRVRVCYLLSHYNTDAHFCVI
jgi:hypothetical protein